MGIRINVEILFLLLMIFVAMSFSNIFFWEIKTNLNDANEILIQSDTIFAATSGGLVLYMLNSGEYQSLTAENGLSDHHFTAIANSPKNLIVTGTLNGTLGFFSTTGKFLSEDYSLKDNQILSIKAIGDTVWVASKKMVAVYLFDAELNRFQFQDFFTNFNLTFNTFRDIEYINKRVWFATDNGLLSAPGNFLKFNLKAASSWSVFTSSDGLPSDNIHSLAVKTDTLLIGTSNGLSFYDFQNFNNFASGLVGRRISHINIMDSDIFVDNKKTIYKFENSTFQSILEATPDVINDFGIDSNGNIWGALREKGLHNFTSDQGFWINGPVDNNLGEILIDSKRRIWVLSGIFGDQRSRGFSLLSPDGVWTNYRHLFPWQHTANTGTIFEDEQGNIWIGSWNGGLTIIDSQFEFYHFNNYTSNGKLWISSVSEDDTIEFTPPDSVRGFLSHTRGWPELLVITDIIADKAHESIWLLALTVQSDAPIIQYEKLYFDNMAFDTTSWEWHKIPNNISIPGNEVASITTDIFNNLWIGTQKSGVLYMRFGDDGEISWTQFTENDFLKSNACLAIEADQDGYVWMGTISGLNTFLNGEIFNLREDAQPIGLIINYIFIDGDNNKWIATDKGLSLLKSSGSPWEPESWVHFVPNTSEFFADNIYHTNLPSEEIRSVFVDEETGDVYCGTASGLAILRSNPFTTPLDNLSKVKVGPVPFILEKNRNNYLYFHNLTANSQVKILTSTGRLVKTLNQENSSAVLGSLAQWDGYNENGEKISSGVYLYLVTDEAGNSSSGKFLVIRK